LRRVPQSAVLRLHQEKVHYQRGISRTTGDRKCPLPYRFSSKPKRFSDILRLEVWKSGENVGLWHALANHADNCCNGNSQASNARDSAHLLGIYGDSLEPGHISLQTARSVISGKDSTVQNYRLMASVLKAWRYRDSPSAGPMALGSVTLVARSLYASGCNI